MLNEIPRPVEISIYGSVTLFDHILHVPQLETDNTTVFVKPIGTQAGLVRFGGCGANQAAAVAAIGGVVELLGVVGDDFTTSGYSQHLDSLGVVTDRLEIVAGRSSGHSYLIHDRKGATFLIVEEGVATQSTPPVSADLAVSSQYLVLNMPFDELALDLASLACERGTNVILSGQVATASDALRHDLLTRAKFLCCNRTEARQIGFLTKSDVRSDRYPNIECAWVTDGANGLTTYLPNGTAKPVPSVPAPGFVDATGAGDAVVAGVTGALAEGATLLEASRVGVTLASFVVEAVGCQESLPSVDEFLRRYESHFGERPAWRAAQSGS